MKLTFKTIKKIAVISIFILFALLLLCGILIQQAFKEKKPKVPKNAYGSLHQSLPVTNGEVRLIVIGDMGRNTPAHKGVADSIERRCQETRPDAMIFLGDNIYVAGVKSIEDPAWDSELMQFYQGECIKQVPIFAVLGNHDYRGNAQAQIDYSAVNSKWHMPFRFYDLSFGNLLSLTVGDGWYLDYCFNENELCSVNFMLDSLRANNDKTWRLVATHFPARSASTQSSNHAGGLRGMMLEQIFCKLDKTPTAYLAGHAHHLEYSTSPVCDMDFIISGSGGGSELYSVSPERNQYQHFVQSIYGFSEILATKNSITYAFFDSDTNELYSHTRKNNDKTTD